MIDQTTTATVTSTIVFEREVAMEFNQDARAQMLEDNINMYQAPYAAVLREYTSNARDAHRANGHTGPVQVTLPNPLAPNLIIRDFGIGMDAQELEQFGQFRVSTKSASNDDIGGFGLGSKSGLAIAPQLTVISVKNGRVNTIIMGRNEHNAPTLGFLEEKETTKPSGTTIIIPTNNGEEFTRAINQGMFLGWERGSIEINGEQPKHSVFDDEVVKVEDFGYILPSEWDYSGFVLIHGTHVPHQIPRYYDSLIDQVMDSAILTIPNGDVKLLRSREGIISKRSTEEYISKAVKALAERGKALLIERIEASDSFAEYYKLLQDNRRIISPSDSAKYKGQTLDELLKYPETKSEVFDAQALAKEQNVSVSYIYDMHDLNQPKTVHKSGRTETTRLGGVTVSRAVYGGHVPSYPSVVVTGTPAKTIPEPAPVINPDGTVSDKQRISPRLPDHLADLSSTTYVGDMGEYEFFIGTKAELPEAVRLLASEESTTTIEIIDFSEFQTRHAAFREKVLNARRAERAQTRPAPTGTYLTITSGTRTVESRQPLSLYTSTHVLDADTGLLTSPSVLLVLVHNPSDTPTQQSKFTPEEQARFDKQLKLYHARIAPTDLNETISSPTGDERQLAFLYIPKSSRSLYLQLKSTYETVDMVDIVAERFETVYNGIVKAITSIPALADAEVVAEGALSDSRAHSILSKYRFNYTGLTPEQSEVIESQMGVKTDVISNQTTLDIQKAVDGGSVQTDQYRTERRRLVGQLEAVKHIINKFRAQGFTITTTDTAVTSDRNNLLRLIGERLRDRYFASGYSETSITKINLIDKASPWALDLITDGPESLRAAGVYWVTDEQIKSALER